MQKQLSELQREKAVWEEKTINAEAKKEELQLKYEAEIEELRNQLGDSSSHLSKEREIILADNQKLKA